jgi:hypothetical protein
MDTGIGRLVVAEGMNLVTKCPCSIPKLDLKLSSSPPPTIHLSSLSSSSPSIGVCTGVESVDAGPAELVPGVGESNVVFKLRFGGEREPGGRAKEEDVGEAEVNVSMGGVIPGGEDGVSDADKLRVYPLGAA